MMAPEVRKLVLSLGIAATLHLVALGSLPLLEPDEGRYADVAREFLSAPSLVVPRANGVPFLDKPPLVCWLGAISIKIFGPSELAVRLVPAMFGILASAVAGWIAWQVYGPRSAALAVMVYATSPLALGVGRTLTLDVPFSALVAGSLALVLRGAGLFAPPPSRILSTLGGVALGLAVLVKGPLAGVLVGAGVTGALCFERGHGAVRARASLALACIACLLVATPWYGAVALAEPDFAKTFLLAENLGRFLGRAGDHREGPFFILGVVAWGLGPWTGAALILSVASWRRPPRDGSVERLRGRGPLVAYVLLVIVFFSVAREKIATYVLPAFPVIAAILAGELSVALERGSPRTKSAVVVWLAAVLTLLALATIGTFFFATGVIPVSSTRAQLARAGLNAWLAPVPLSLLGGALACTARRQLGNALLLAALGMLGLGVFVLGGASSVARLRSAAPVASRILELRRGDEKIGVYYHYYRGLPFYVNGPVHLLGTSGELRRAAFRARPDLLVEDPAIPAFLSENRPFLVVVPNGQNRSRRFLAACSRARIEPIDHGEWGDDRLFEIPRGP